MGAPLLLRAPLLSESDGGEVSRMRLPAVLPALPSRTKGPASFLGVMGPSCTRSGLRPLLPAGYRGDSPTYSFAPLTLMDTGCVTDDVGGVRRRSGVSSTVWFSMFVSWWCRSVRSTPPSESVPLIWATEARGVT